MTKITASAADAFAGASSPASTQPVSEDVEGREAARKLAKVSVRARKLYRRLCDGRYYPAFAKDTPQAMGELQAAGLVGMMGRSPVIALYYVPHGSKPGSRETISAYPSDAALRAAQAGGDQ